MNGVHGKTNTGITLEAFPVVLAGSVIRERLADAFARAGERAGVPPFAESLKRLLGFLRSVPASTPEEELSHALQRMNQPVQFREFVRAAGGRVRASVRWRTARRTRERRAGRQFVMNLFHDNPDAYEFQSILEHKTVCCAKRLLHLPLCDRIFYSAQTFTIYFPGDTGRVFSRRAHSRAMRFRRHADRHRKLWSKWDTGEVERPDDTPSNAHLDKFFLLVETDSFQAITEGKSHREILDLIEFMQDRMHPGLLHSNVVRDAFQYLRETLARSLSELAAAIHLQAERYWEHVLRQTVPRVRWPRIPRPPDLLALPPSAPLAPPA